VDKEYGAILHMPKHARLTESLHKRNSHVPVEFFASGFQALLIVIVFEIIVTVIAFRAVLVGVLLVLGAYFFAR
jgi:hypothetical protein